MTDGLKTSEGKITEIIHENRIFTFRPDSGFGVDIKWSEPLDEKMGKFKPNYKVRVTYETGKSGNWLTEIISLYKKNDGGGSGKGQQKDERLILMEVIYKEASTTARATIVLPDTTFNIEQFNEVQEAITESTKKTFKALMEAAGEKQ